MVRGMFAFLIGVYAGIYISQNYDLPKVDDPSALVEKVKEFADKHRKS